jgi:hypothetical protein
MFRVDEYPVLVCCGDERLLVFVLGLGSGLSICVCDSELVYI